MKRLPLILISICLFACTNESYNKHKSMELAIESKKIAQWGKVFEMNTQAIGLDTTNYLAYFNRAIAGGSLFKDSLSIAKDFQKAIQYGKEYVEKNPDDDQKTLAFIHGLIGTSYSKLNAFDIALQEFDKGIELDPNQPRLYKERGIAKRKLSLLEDALDDLNKAIELDPQYQFAYHSRATTLARLNRYEASFEDFTHAIKLRPEDNKSWFSRGTLYMAIGDTTKACHDLQKAMTLNHREAKIIFDKACNK